MSKRHLQGKSPDPHAACGRDLLARLPKGGNEPSNNVVRKCLTTIAFDNIVISACNVRQIARNPRASELDPEVVRQLEFLADLLCGESGRLTQQRNGPCPAAGGPLWPSKSRTEAGAQNGPILAALPEILFSVVRFDNILKSVSAMKNRV